ncbi:hypothetical protein [Marisediminicola sp. LYQ134]|uniref:hypothetical protein n=1 Tax=Marisediminicola sp. LYQ134 TaxID=3391061 RepID=UPI003982E941
MSTFRNPVGPQPSSVYWRRRLIFILGLVAVIVVVVLIVSRFGGGASAPTVAPSPSASAPAEAADDESDDGEDAEPTADQEEGAPCDPSNLELTAVADQNAYGSGESPQLSFTIANTSSSACTVDVSTDLQSYEITSGAELYWSSTHCAGDTVEATVTLEPNVPQSPTPITWDRTRSDPDACDAEPASVPAGGATYNLDVSVGDVEAEAPVSFLLN